MDEPDFSESDIDHDHDHELYEIYEKDNNIYSSSNTNSIVDNDDNNYVIDMDSEPDEIIQKQITKPIKSVKTIPTKKPIERKPIERKPIEKTKVVDKTKTGENIIKKKIVEKNKISSKGKEEKEDKQDKQDKEEKEEKESASDAKFEFNEETIEYFSKEIINDYKKICIVNSSFNNDTALLCLLLRLKIFTEYKCSVKKCKVGKTWLTKPIQLLIHRKNGRMQDLNKENLELICPNCYIAKYGIDLFQKVITKTVYTCKICNYPLEKFSNSKKKERYCMACEARIVNTSYFSKKNEFINELKETIDNESTLKKDEFTKTNYYNEVSKFKNFNTTSQISSSSSKNTKVEDKKNKSSNQNLINDKPIINLNMTIPDLNDIIKEEITDKSSDDEN